MHSYPTPSYILLFCASFLMQHLLRVTPVVGILWDKKAFNPMPSPAEVEALFDAPFEMFLKVPLVFFLLRLLHL